MKGDKMDMTQKFDWFIAKLEKEGYQYAEGNLKGCATYKYAGDVEILKGSIVNICKIKGEYSFDEIKKVKAELVIGNRHYKTSSMEDLIDEIEKIKDTNDISDFSKLED